MDLKGYILKRRRQDAVFGVLGLVLTIVVLVVLAVLIVDLTSKGFSRINLDFLTSFPSRRPERAGIYSAWVGSLLIMVLTGVVGVPLGMAAGVYLEEYAKRNWFTNLIELNITNLAGVPSIVYGLMALGLFVYQLKFGQSILSGGLTLAFLILPIVIVATRETLRAIPANLREAAYALGATRWQVVQHHLMPYSTGGIATGVIIAMGRAIGETAPLITIGALTFIAFLPPAPYSEDAMAAADAWAGSGGMNPLQAAVYPAIVWVKSPFTVLPIQMFNWVSRPGEDFVPNAAAAGIVLVVATLGMNAVAILIRYRMRRRIKW